MNAKTNQQEKAQRFRQLHSGPGILVLPNAWDAAGARLFEEAGFPAVGTTSAGLANALGYPDGEAVPRDEMLFVVRRIVQTVETPVTVDIEAGFGKSVDDVVQTVREVLAAGAVGVNLEDRAQEGEALAGIQEQTEKIEALRRLANDEACQLSSTPERTHSIRPLLFPLAWKRRSSEGERIVRPVRTVCLCHLLQTLRRFRHWHRASTDR